MHRHTLAVLILLAAALTFRLLFVASNVHDLVDRGPLYDDSFYAFGVARHIAAGQGSTFDLEHPTNGFQPLWVGTLVPLYWLADGDVPIRLALVLSSLLDVATGWLLYRLLRRRLEFAPAFLGVVLWAFAPAVVRQAVNGLETALALCCLALALHYYLGRFREVPGPRQAATLGGLLGFAVLARVDAVVFVVALAVDGWRRRAPWRPWARALGVLVLVVLPWCLVSLAVVGRLTPESGEATRFLSIAYAAHDIPALGPAGAGAVHAPLWAHNLGRSFLLLGTSPGLHVFTRSLERLLDLWGASEGLKLAAVVAFLAAAAVGTVLLLRPRGRSLRRDYGFLGVYGVLLVLAYSCVVFGHIFFSRYYYPIFFVSILLTCEVVDVLLQHLPPRCRRAAAVAVTATYLLLLPVMTWNRMRMGDYRFVNVVRWIENETPPAARFGIFNSGAIGYFSSRRVLNLDGKVNPEALAALHRGDLRTYVLAEHIDYVVDHGWILDRFLRPGEARGGVHFTRVADESVLGVPGWRAYRVTPLPATAAAQRVTPLPATAAGQRGLP